jgi:hypothetical protein
MSIDFGEKVRRLFLFGGVSIPRALKARIIVSCLSLKEDSDSGVRHTTESLSPFKDRHDTMIRAFKALGIDTPSEEEQAADLLSKVMITLNG